MSLEKTSVRFDPETRSRLDGLAKTWGMTRGAVVRSLVADGLKASKMVHLTGFTATGETERC